MSKVGIWHVTWVDSRTDTTSWSFMEDLDEPKPMRIDTVGYVIKDGKDAVSIAQNRSVDGKQFSHVLIIPKVCIVKKRRIGELE